MSASFDPYHTWLGIAPDEQPANHYRLLGLRAFEGNADVIDHAADRQMAHLRSVAAGPRAALAQRLLDEVAAARVCLLDIGRRRAYDAILRDSLLAQRAVPHGELPRPISLPPVLPPLVSGAADSLPNTFPRATQPKSSTPIRGVQGRASRRSKTLETTAWILVAAVVGIAATVYLATRDYDSKAQVAQPNKDEAKRPPPPVRNPQDAAPRGPIVPHDDPDTSQPAPSPSQKVEVSGAPEPDAAPSVPVATPADPETSLPPADPDAESPASLAELVESQDLPESRLPTPSPTVLETKTRAIRELFAKDLARRKPEEVAETAQRFLTMARETTDDKVARYVLFDEARRQASQVGDIAVVRSAIEELAKEFAVDDVGLHGESILVASRAAILPAARPALAAELDLAATNAFAADRFSLADDLNHALGRIARLAKLASLIDRHVVLTESLAECQRAWPETKSALEKLATAPDDPAANETVGRFYCFAKQDWPKGIVYLAKGKGERLRALASAELKPERDANATLALGNGWWELAATMPPRARVAAQRRAAAHYEVILPGLTGLDLVAVEKRLSAAEVVHWISKTASYVVAPGDGLKREPPLSSFLDGGEKFYGDSQQGEWAFVATGPGSHITVDLGGVANIVRIEIWNRPVQARAKGMTVALSNNPQGPWRKVWFAEEDDPNWSFELPASTRARYVRLGLRDDKRDDPWFHLKAMKVYGFFRNPK